MVSRKSALMKTMALVVIAAFSFGCYNTYYLSQESFSGLQSSEAQSKSVTTKDSKKLQVTAGSKLFVKSEGGRRYQITPFNFKMTKSQLVASDRDYILMLNQLKSYEVDQVSTVKTVLLIGLGVAAVTGLIVGVVATAGEKGFGN